MLTKLWLENFKSWKDTGEIPLKPITGLFRPQQLRQVQPVSSVAPDEADVRFPGPGDRVPLRR